MKPAKIRELVDLMDKAYGPDCHLVGRPVGNDYYKLEIQIIRGTVMLHSARENNIEDAILRMIEVVSETLATPGERLARKLAQEKLIDTANVSIIARRIGEFIDAEKAKGINTP